jgi:nicotinate-nucleotide pyrophosphorylase (carboxylating)
LEEALEYGAEAILLDNMTPEEVKRSVERIRSVTGRGKSARWIPTEASGGIVLENIRAYAETGVDFISVGALTHSAKAADISMHHRRGARIREAPEGSCCGPEIFSGANRLREKGSF